MRGYPKYVHSKRDYDKLLCMPDYSGRAKASLSALSKIDDSIVTIEEGTLDNPKLKEISNPMPIWKSLGYKSKSDLSTSAAVGK